ncbi:CubicO group peptidase, beta-lactamase class C family [Micromonospora phaseoli]|uniref:CubicO group peptidase, beta-lactamase class C family n=1 Tax=Micromonospora phaseoli TaxID=1144548 RepID=A0A1H7B8P3_9ACTN|nr:serine hydrolase domain-containing protein [Micromonospora phaseoli]PZV95211.1 CubicO group peptidase (beta-lactamase class C family) [Micromonospora phaseoli]GIJ79032.1 FmtA-like protein [Micromonospora phaseoli]SEJ72647.1 CubicO group peptidase, beta-lactamase class C family [Micromonospora phaseoli]
MNQIDAPEQTASRSNPRRSAPHLRRLGVALATVVVVAAGVVGCGAGAAQEPAPTSDAPAAAVEPGVLDASDVNAWLDEMLPAALEANDIAGATVAVVNDGGTVTTRGYGHVDTGGEGTEPVPVDSEQHLFRIGSVSKLATATAAMQLVQDGHVDLDADIATYLDFAIPRNFDEPITMRHLLTHTPGFEERIAGLIGKEGTKADLRNALVTDPPEQIYRPGTVPAYSNYGNSLAGYIVERVSGIPFEEYVDRNVFDRLGMTSSSFDQPLPADLAGRVSNGYDNASSPAGYFEIVGTPPAGSMTASAPDMARFMLAHLGEPVGDTPILDEPTLDLMHQPALDATTLGTLAGAPRMTLGFFDESRNGRRIIGHGGDTLYFHTHLQIYPDEGAGLFISLNSTGTSALANHQLRQDLTKAFADRYFPAVPGAAANDVPAGSAERAAMAAGTYESSRAIESNFLTLIGLSGRTTVSVRDDGRLLLEPRPMSDSAAVYEEIEPWVWREVGGQETIAMRAVDGQVEAIGFDSAFALVPVETARSTYLAIPVIVGSVVILLLTVLAWPIGAIGRRLRRRAPRDRAGRTARILSRVAVGCALLAVGGWVGSLVLIMGLEDLSTVSLRNVQVAQLIGLLGVIPAAVRLVDDVRRRVGWSRTAGSALVLLALVGTGWFAVEFMLLSPNISY